MSMGGRCRCSGGEEGGVAFAGGEAGGEAPLLLSTDERNAGMSGFGDMFSTLMNFGR